MDTSIKDLHARRAALIESLATERRDADLRRFACWCARRTDLSGTDWDELVDAANQFASADVSLAEMLDVRNRHSGKAMAASVVGLNHGAANAAAFLSAWQTTRQNAAESATQSAEMAAIWRHMKTNGRGLEQDRQSLEAQVDELSRLALSSPA